MLKKIEKILGKNIRKDTNIKLKKSYQNYMKRKLKAR